MDEHIEVTETKETGKNKKSSKTVISSGSNCGIIWAIGWLFTIGFVKLTFWKGVLALIIWPYYLGDFLTNMK